MTVQEFEEKVWSIDTIRVVVRANANDIVGDYSSKNATTGTWSLSEWLRKKVERKLSGKEVKVIAGDGEEPHGRTLLRTIRRSYELR